MQCDGHEQRPGQSRRRLEKNLKGGRGTTVTAIAIASATTSMQPTTAVGIATAIVVASGHLRSTIRPIVTAMAAVPFVLIFVLILYYFIIVLVVVNLSCPLSA